MVPSLIWSEKGVRLRAQGLLSTPTAQFVCCVTQLSGFLQTARDCKLFKDRGSSTGCVEFSIRELVDFVFRRHVSTQGYLGWIVCLGLGDGHVFTLAMNGYKAPFSSGLGKGSRPPPRSAAAKRDSLAAELERGQFQFQSVFADCINHIC